MQWAGCGEPHLIFAGGAEYVPPAAAGRERRALFDELTELGVTVGKELDPEFERWLHVLDRPHTEYYAYARTGDEQFGVLIAVRGSTTVVAEHHDKRVWLRSVGERDYPALLVELLPSVRPAAFTPFSLPASAYPGSGPEARQLDTLLDPPPRGMGHLHTARRPGGGPRQQAVAPVSYLDTAAGRVGIEHTADAHLTVFPGDPTGLAARLAAARSTLD
ncbi:hypothetical protein BAY60_07050 [Prauserella muralis]|uniref:ESAT-6 protein secretion system EspG family protein n=2 Tax=Prauserella muralis TaxID=588067 RepID=A0A2V4BBY9_9PSEU|nr:hypothetical protein BAY60_07050 [Prauserella muralis]